MDGIAPRSLHSLLKPAVIKLIKLIWKHHPHTSKKRRKKKVLLNSSFQSWLLNLNLMKTDRFSVAKYIYFLLLFEFSCICKYSFRCEME